jgi:branched-chain amino acid aminotransferase
MPFTTGPEVICSAIQALVDRLDYKKHMYIRPTLYIDNGRYGYDLSQVTCGSYIVAFPVERSPLSEIGARVCVSTWRRSSDLVFPPRAKAGAAYQAFRLPIIEAKERGLDDAVILNDNGTVAETTGAALFIRRNSKVSTPPVTASILESITREIIIEILEKDFGVLVEQRDVDRTELYVSDEIFMCGTLCEVQPIIEVDGVTIGSGTPGSLTQALRDRYFAICESGEQSTPWITDIRTIGIAESGD